VNGFVLRNAQVVDGTGAPGYPADVAVVDGRVAAIGPGLSVSADLEEVDLAGLVLSPGFVDIHTHYDAQVLWDGDLTPSSWHGVTTVLVGNCGFGIAPTRPEGRSLIAKTLENVEGMTLEALEAGISWEFESFPGYLDHLDRLPKRLNVTAMVGHTPLRLYALGEDASRRAATPDEVAGMRRLVREALDAGAAGFASSNSGAHIGAFGRPVPSRLADMDEYRELTGAVGESGHGLLQITFGPQLGPAQFAEMADRTGRPVTWTALLTGQHDSTLKVVERQAGYGAAVWPQIACRPLVAQVTMGAPSLFGRADAFLEVLALPRSERAQVYHDEAWRARARVDVEPHWSHRWAKTTVQESARHAGIVDGPTVAELAAGRGVHPLDVMLDLALEEDLDTRYLVVLCNDDEDEIGGLLRDDRTLLGLSDAGAHVSQLCDACYSTHLLGHWVRDKGVLTLEQAVWRLTGQPAALLGLEGRGVLREGAIADLVAFDPDTVSPLPATRVRDFPGGADRLVADSQGVEHMWVGGVATRRDGKEIVGARPGRLLRGGR